jgi:ectoine hydroxylase-related dioxygenase (phytanoyl-CoA dioxygenase family)
MASTESVQRAVREFNARGYCVLPRHFQAPLVGACKSAFWPRLLAYLSSAPLPNRGPHRHFLAMPFDPPCFSPQFFFDPDVLSIVRTLMDDRIAADQWGCDIPLLGSEYQELHADYRRPLFPEVPDLPLPSYAVVVSFGLTRIGREHGPIEIAPGTHRMTQPEGNEAIRTGRIATEPVLLEIGDVLIRHPWALHRGSPNTTATPRALVTIRYVRRWYADASRDVEGMPRTTWESLTAEEQSMLRFPIRN